jgi:dTDP-4-dehydrorhamnose 3,5-epimerase
MYLISETKINDCFLLRPSIHSDARGSFVKTYHKDKYKEYGLNVDFKEDFYSISKKNVIRGFHLGKFPSNHEKTVTCLNGSVEDVILDLRIGSPSFGHYESFELNSINKNILYIPEGVAHGFCSKSENSILYYKVTSLFNPEDDIGILWNSTNYQWSVKNPIISERDKNLPKFSNFESPFNYKK